MHRFQEKQKYYDEKDKLILELFRTNPQSAFKLMFDTYYMPLCLYAVQLTDSFSMAEDIVQDFFISFWEKKTYQNIAVKLRSYLFYAIRNNSYLSLRKNNLVSMEELFDTEIDITESITDEEELREKENHGRTGKAAQTGTLCRASGDSRKQKVQRSGRRTKYIREYPENPSVTCIEALAQR